MAEERSSAAMQAAGVVAQPADAAPAPGGALGQAGLAPSRGGQAAPAAEAEPVEEREPVVPLDPAGLAVDPNAPAVVADDRPTGVGKYVYVKGLGRVRWDDMSPYAKERYLIDQHRPLKGGRPKPPPEHLRQSKEAFERRMDREARERAEEERQRAIDDETPGIDEEIL